MSDLTEYIGPWQFRCTVCGRVWFMERRAAMCHPPIKWTAPERVATARDHLDAIEAWVTEAALDLNMDEDTVWHDVAVGYLVREIHDPSMRTECARALGIPASAFRQG